MRIVHIFRAPTGGLFRHVLDLARGQIARGHEVGLIMDSLTSNARADATLQPLEPQLALGLARVPMDRQPSPRDLTSVLRIAALIRDRGVDIIHGHGAKGGAYARLVHAPNATVRAYTPHGGSLHDSIGGKLHLLLEKLLMRRGNLYLFESAYAHDAFFAKVGNPAAIVRVIHNGVGEAEFAPVAADPQATDVVFLGELRTLKGVDLLIEAVALLQHQGRPIGLTLVGDGPDTQLFRAQAEEAGLAQSVRFRAPMPARAAFALGRVLAMPSRAESLPYVALEAAAAGKPLVATRVGGIPEIFGPLAGELIAPDDAPALARALARMLDDPAGAQERAQTLRQRVAAQFSIERMVDGVLAAYQQARDAATSPARAPHVLVGGDAAGMRRLH